MGLLVHKALPVTQDQKDHQVLLEFLVPLVVMETLDLMVLMELQVLVDCLAIPDLLVKMVHQDQMVLRYVCDVSETLLHCRSLFRDSKDMLVTLVMLDHQDQL